ncbi:MAG TPA: aminopeptidase P family protein [Microbacteriaceae bacterium]|nr:aminopeptidase P family protein [Microbacteriaceae bacterium]
MTEETGRNANRSTVPNSSGFTEHISQHWAPRPGASVAPGPAELAASRRRAELSAAFAGVRLVVGAGGPKVRSNDDDYRYRAYSAFSYYTGWGADTVPESVLVLEPEGSEHRAVLYFRPTADRTTEEFYADASIGEFWVGARPGLSDIASRLGVETRDLADFAADRERWSGPTSILRESDEALTATLDAWRSEATRGDDDTFAEFASEQRLVKDEYEIAEMRAAIASTAAGFDDVLAALPRAQAATRGERLIEGVFFTRARIDGNDVGYGSIAAAGAHATILHWTRNDGLVRPGELVLLDAGVERESFYTADITRTFPVNGSFSPVQRQVYEAVLEAADAAFAVVRPGIVFREVHAAAMAVIARKTAEWGFLPVSAEESLEPEHQYHRRYMVHGTSHHLGIDVHDCAQARKEFYIDGVVREGMIFTIEPGLYFQPDDLTVPESFRGIGVRIEDDILVTATGAENLSSAIPRTVADVESWVQRLAR